jgi:anti-sigma factor RsiW
MNENTDEIDEIEALLPWYAAGALKPAEALRVEAALERRPDLRASLALIREDRGETIALNESLGAPGPDVWTRVLAVAEAEPRKPGLGERVAAWLGLGADARAGRLAWIGGAAAVVIAVQAVAILALAPSGPGYRVASGPSANARGAVVMVQFAPDARLDLVAAFLKAHDATIIDGPRGGFFRLRVGETPLTAEETKAMIAALTASPIVKTALPAGAR